MPTSCVDRQESPVEPNYVTNNVSRIRGRRRQRGDIPRSVFEPFARAVARLWIKCTQQILLSVALLLLPTVQWISLATHFLKICRLWPEWIWTSSSATWPTFPEDGSSSTCSNQCSVRKTEDALQFSAVQALENWALIATCWWQNEFIKRWIFGTTRKYKVLWAFPCILT